MATAFGITLGLWIAALVSSTIPALTVLGINAHGLSLADYPVTPLRHFAPSPTGSSRMSSRTG